METTRRDGMLGKICTGCRIWKSLAEFYRRSAAKDGLFSRCKKCTDERHRRWVEEHREEVNEQNRQRHAENHEKRNDRQRQRYAENREEILEKRRRDRAENPEKFRERNRQHYADNPEPYKIKATARKASNRAVGDLVLTTPQWQQILADWGGHCAYCANTEEYCIEHRGGKLVREHVLPDSQGGLFTATNIVPACPQCNGRKGPRTPEQAGMMVHWEFYNPTGMVIQPDF